MSSSEPSKWTTALGASADVNVIPATTPAGTGLASMSSLFPAITQVPIDAGGIAPERADFNALFKMLGDQSYFLQQGGVYSYSSSYAYSVGDLVRYSGALYACVAANGPGNVHAPTDTAYWRKLATLQDIPPAATVGNGTITVQSSGTSIGAFTVNQAGNTNINIPEATDSAFGVIKNDQNGFDLGAVQGWIRLRSGVQIVYGAGLSNTPITFARAFIRPPTVSAMCTAAGTQGGAFACLLDHSDTSMTIGVWDTAVNMWVSDASFTYIAIDHWK